MTQEDKQLLLQDLCARLPYKCKYKASKEITHWHKLTLSTGTIDKIIDDYYDDIKPYLRPMSSMTDGEKEELTEEHKKDERIYIDVIERVANGDKHARGTAVPHFAADWCNEHHFDCRGLIENGLAIAVTEENNPYK